MTDETPNTSEAGVNNKLLIGLGVGVLLIAGGIYFVAGKPATEGVAPAPTKAGIVIETPTTTIAANGDAVTVFSGTVANPEFLNSKFELVLVAYAYNESVDRASVFAYLKEQGGHRISVDVVDNSWSTSFVNLKGGRYKMFVYPARGTEDARISPVIAGLFDFVEPER